LRFTTVGGTTIKVGCSGPIHLENAMIQHPDLALVDSIVFLNCDVIEPANCRLENLTIKTLPIEGLATLGRITFKPKTKALFTELPFAEETPCAVGGLIPVKGSVTANTGSNNAEEALTHTLQPLGSVENNSLEVGAGSKGFIEGATLLLALASGSKWSFHA
jgi:hypothetical protein